MTPEQIFQTLLGNTGFSVLIIALGALVLLVGKIHEVFSPLKTDRVGRQILGIPWVLLIFVVIGVISVGEIYKKPAAIQSQMILFSFTTVMFAYSKQFVYDLRPERTNLNFLTSQVLSAMAFIPLVGSWFLIYKFAGPSTWLFSALFGLPALVFLIGANSLNMGERKWVRIQTENVTEEGVLENLGDVYVQVLSKETGKTVRIRGEKVDKIENLEPPEEFAVKGKTLKKRFADFLRSVKESFLKFVWNFKTT